MRSEGGKREREGSPGHAVSAERRVSPARLAAFNILRRVEEESAYASVLLAASDEEMRADDHALCYELVLGVLRRQLWLDSLINHYARRKAENLDAPVRRALRLGLYQLRFLSRIPASAVVNEAVNLAYLARLRSAAPFINAVLRRAAREPDYDPAANVEDEYERLAIETSHPAWLLKRWAEAFGLNEALALARADNEAPPLAFRVVETVESESEVLAELRTAGGRLLPSRVAPAGWRLEGAGARLRELAREGKVYLQDEASQLVAHVLQAREGERVLDACAAPGSKSTHIASLAPDLKVLVAGDVHEHRLRVILEAAVRQKIETLSAVVHDASLALPFRDGSFDRVLVDAPCTGTGTLRRNPEIRWRITPRDINELAERQHSILRQAARAVRPGGRLVYSTCSVEPEENEDVTNRFLDGDGRFRQAALENVPEGVRVAADGRLRTWPHREGADGFFITAFERLS